MKVIVVKKDAFVSKEKKVPFVKLHYITPEGKTGSVFTTQDKYSSFKYDESKICSKETLDKIVLASDLSDVEFDENGYVVGLE